MSSNWQPIETAPKDGRPFLAVGMGPIFIARWADGLNGWLDAAGLERSPKFWAQLPEGPRMEVVEGPKSVPMQGSWGCFTDSENI